MLSGVEQSDKSKAGASGESNEPKEELSAFNIGLMLAFGTALVWAICMTVFYVGTDKGDTKKNYYTNDDDDSTLVTLSMYYDKAEFSDMNTWVETCDFETSTETSNCIIETFNAHLYDSTTKAKIGNVQFYDVLQYNGEALYVDELATYQFDQDAVPGYPAYFSYDYSFESQTGNSVWPDGYELDVLSYTASFSDFGFTPVITEMMVVSGTVRNVELTYDSVAPNTAVLDKMFQFYYDSAFFTYYITPCEEGRTDDTDCTLEYFDTPLFNLSGHKIGNVQWEDISQFDTDGNRWISEYGTYQFDDPSVDMPIKHFVYNYNNPGGDSLVWSSGFNFEIDSYASAIVDFDDNNQIVANNVPVHESLMVWGTQRVITITYNDSPQNIAGTDNTKACSYNKNDFADTFYASPCNTTTVTGTAGADSCTVENYNAPVYDGSSGSGTVIGNVQFYDVLYTRGGFLYVTEEASFQFFEETGAYPRYFTYQFAFESATGSSVWPNGYEVDVTSFSSSAVDGYPVVRESLVIANDIREITLNW